MAEVAATVAVTVGVATGVVAAAGAVPVGTGVVLVVITVGLGTRTSTAAALAAMTARGVGAASIPVEETRLHDGVGDLPPWPCPVLWKGRYATFPITRWLRAGLLMIFSGSHPCVWPTLWVRRRPTVPLICTHCWLQTS